MNWLDVLLVLILAASLITSFRKGLTREIIGLASVIVGILAGSWLYGTAGSFLLPYLSSRALANFAGFLIVFFSVLVLGGLVSFVTGRVLKVTGLSVVDHLLGAAFGLVRGILICVALVLGLMAFSLSDRPPNAVVHSRVAPYVIDVARVVAAAAPHELKDGFSRSYSQVKDVWAKTLKQGIQKAPEESKKNERKI